jgi:hypothetical protein
MQRLPSAAVHISALCTQASFLCPLYIPICMPIYIPIYTLHTGLLSPIYRYIYVYIYICIYECIYRIFFLVFFPLKRLPPSFTRLEASIPHTHTHFDLYFFVVDDSNTSFGGRLRHRLVAPVFHGSATLTRPMLQPYLYISIYLNTYMHLDR